MAILSVALGLLYKLTPNTKVEFKRGHDRRPLRRRRVAWLQSIGLSLAVAARTNASKYYGGSRSIVLRSWADCTFSWLILLFGAKCAYAYQNRWPICRIASRKM